MGIAEFVVHVGILWTIGIILLVIGIILLLLGCVGHAVGGRRHYWYAL
ncbi:DUF6131 family protein [Streptomyces sp. NPDC046197]